MVNRIKQVTVILGLVMMVGAAGLVCVSVNAADDFKADATYTTKCKSCHGAKAEKKFDATIADDQLVEFVMKGKKAEKPPNMPAYGAKGITAEQAKALVDYMKSLKQ